MTFNDNTSFKIMHKKSLEIEIDYRSRLNSIEKRKVYSVGKT